jgi:hypothetical protein
LVFVAPGIPWSERVERRQSWRRNEATFRQISRGVVWSAWFSLPATLITLLGLRLVAPSEFAGIRSWTLGGAHPTGWTVITVTAAAFVELLIALAIMRLVWIVLANRLYGTTDATAKSAWELFLKHDNQSARVFLSDGTSWVGPVRAFSTDNEWANREVVLTDPRRVDANGVAGPAAEGRIIIPSSEISGVLVDGEE